MQLGAQYKKQALSVISCYECYVFLRQTDHFTPQLTGLGCNLVPKEKGGCFDRISHGLFATM